MEILLGLSLTAFVTVLTIDTVQQRRVNLSRKTLTKR